MTILLYDLVGEDHGRPFSPHCWKTTMCLAHKGLDYRRMPTPFTSVPAVESGMSKTVPVIRDGDRLVADSFAIALYLDDAYPERPTLFGGEGGVSGTLLGALLLATLANYLNLVGVSPFTQQIIQGAVLALAILLDGIQRRRRA